MKIYENSEEEESGKKLLRHFCGFMDNAITVTSNSNQVHFIVEKPFLSNYHTVLFFNLLVRARYLRFRTIAAHFAVAIIQPLTSFLFNPYRLLQVSIQFYSDSAVQYSGFLASYK